MINKGLLLLIFILFIFSVLSFAQLPKYVPSNGLIGWWPFNGNANDESGNGYDGVVNGAVLTSDRFGIENKAFSFDGFNDNILLKNLCSKISSSKISISVWTFGDSYKIQSIFQDDLGLMGNRIVTHLHYTFTGNAYWDFGNIDNRGRLNCFVASSNLKTWEHYVFIADSSEHKLEIFKDGFLVCSSYDRLPHFNNFIGDICIGGVQAPSALPAYFDGKLDDIGFWNRILTQDEILDLYRSKNTEEPNETEFFNIWPNPTTDLITVNMGIIPVNAGYKIKMTNILGQQVRLIEVTQKQFSIRMPIFGAGVYFVYIVDNNKKIVDCKKVIVM